MAMYDCKKKCLCASCGKIIRNCAECKLSVKNTKICLNGGIKECEGFEEVQDD